MGNERRILYLYDCRRFHRQQKIGFSSTEDENAVRDSAGGGREKIYSFKMMLYTGLRVCHTINP